MISRFFIEHPRFSFVISIVITLAGLIAVFTLPVAQYPNITPGQVSITTTYPGADAKTVQETVIQPLETQINGVKKMLYVSSTATDNGSATITVTFDIGTDGDMNTVNTQNRVNWASAQLPEEVRRQSVIVKEKSSNMLLVLALYSPNSTYDSLFLNNYATISIKDELARIPGVGDVELLGEQKYSMRIWLDSDRMAHLNLTVEDVTSAIQAQNVQVSAGALGDAPSNPNQVHRFSIQTQGRMQDPKEFERILIRSTSEGEQVFLRDIATVELGAESYASNGFYNGKPAALIAIYQLNDANGLAIAKAVNERLEELRVYFPEDLAYGVPFDTTAFINASIHEVVETLFIAVGLVVLVTFLFLQDWRATLVPTIAIPVSLIGTFAVMSLIGFTINLITLFGLILAIGIVVDDAIIVIENINRLMEEEKLDPKAAAIKSMEQVTGPVVATTLVLMAMFIPVCFLPGITGEMYRQFGITISVAVLISSINALSLSPALSAMLLKPVVGERKKFFLFAWFDKGFEKLTSGYLVFAGPAVRRTMVMLVFYAILGTLAVILYKQLPTGFIPDEDQGKLFVNVQLPDAASLSRTEEVVRRLAETGMKTPGVQEVIEVPGYSILTSAQASNNGLLLFSLKPWKDRKARELQQDFIMRKLNQEFAAIPEAQISVFGMPVIQGLGNTGGFSLALEDTTGTSPERLRDAIEAITHKANQHPALENVFSTFRAETPQLYLEIDREKALKMGVTLDSVNNALQGLTGYTYVNDFNKYGKVFKVEIQAKEEFRDSAEKLRNLYVRNQSGDMVPLGTLIRLKQISSPQYLNRYNLYSSATINGMNASGYSSGQAMRAMEEIARAEVPAGMKFEWTDMSYQEQIAGKGLSLPGGITLDMMIVITGLSLLFVYLFLVAQYESWMLPLGVLLSVPAALLGALAGLYIAGLDNNIYTQVGLVLLFGIACKTAILIIEFAKHQHESGKSIAEAAMAAAKLRFRAVLMTAVSFILGTLPLIIATGAGAASRHSLGTAVFWGMVAAAVVGTVLIPGFFVAVQKTIEFTGRSKEKK